MNILKRQKHEQRLRIVKDEILFRGSKGRSPLASLGTAQGLAPVHSGFPLCETCLSSSAFPYIPITFSFPCTYKKKQKMAVVLWDAKNVKEREMLPFSENFYSPEHLFGIPLRCEVPDNYVPYPALNRHICWLFYFFHSFCHPLRIPPFSSTTEKQK